MDKKRLWSFIIVFALLFSTQTPTGVLANVKSDVKELHVNNTTMQFVKIIYINNVKGNDTTGDGSRDNPFASVKKGFDYMSENCKKGGAIVISDGNYDVRGLFTGNSNNLNNKYDQMNLSIFAEVSGNVKFINIGEWMVVENVTSSRIKLKFYGIIFQNPISSEVIYHLGGDDWMNEYYNCLFPAGYGGYNARVSSARILAENCIFVGMPYTYHYNNRSLSGYAINCASNTQYMDPSKGIKENALYKVTFDSKYNITSSGWKNAGVGENPDGTRAHIGVYGGQFGWGSKVNETSEEEINKYDIVMKVGEVLKLSIQSTSDNSEMTWVSRDETIARVDHNGIVATLREGEVTIAAANKFGNITDLIHITIDKDADDFRLSVDLSIGDTRRVTIDNNKQEADVTWISADNSVATISSKGDVIVKGKGLTYITAICDDIEGLRNIYIKVK